MPVFAAALCLGPAMAESCSGCGCKGGPGYRGPSGRCVGYADIGRVCGSPPTSKCTAEGPNAGADEAAEHGVRASNSRFLSGRPARKNDAE